MISETNKKLGIEAEVVHVTDIGEIGWDLIVDPESGRAVAFQGCLARPSSSLSAC